MPSNGLSVINTDGLSDVAVKLLDMIEKSVGWTVSPKGSQRDFEDAVEYYKHEIMDDVSIPTLVKSAKIAAARKELRQYINQGQIIAEALPHIQSSSDLHNLNPDWLSYFF